MPGIFSRIINGEIPCYKVFENDKVYAFLDINPVQPGHVLVVPKIEIDQFVDVPDEFYLEVFNAAKRISKAQKKALGVARICTKIEGFDVPHFHYHLIPCNTAQDFTASPNTISADDMQKIADKINEAL